MYHKNPLVIASFLLLFAISQEGYCFDYYKFDDRTKDFIACDMNTVMIAVLTNKSIMVFLILSKFMIIREPMFFEKIPLENGVDVQVIEYYIFAMVKDGMKVFKIMNGKIELIKSLEEKDVIIVEKSYLDLKNSKYYFYKEKSISIYNEFFNKIKEVNLSRDFKFIGAAGEESIYKDNKGNHYLIRFDNNSNLYKEEKNVKGQILFFSGRGNYISKEGEDVILISNNFEIMKKIYPLKDLKKLPKYKELKEYKINKVLSQRGKLCIMGESTSEGKENKITIIYDSYYNFCKVESPCIGEIFNVDVEGNQFGDIVFISKNTLEFFCHGSYYSCSGAID